MRSLAGRGQSGDLGSADAEGEAGLGGMQGAGCRQSVGGSTQSL